MGKIKSPLAPLYQGGNMANKGGWRKKIPPSPHLLEDKSPLAPLYQGGNMANKGGGRK